MHEKNPSLLHHEVFNLLFHPSWYFKVLQWYFQLVVPLKFLLGRHRRGRGGRGAGPGQRRGRGRRDRRWDIPTLPSCTCELEIVCTFECVICNILRIPDIFGRLWFINVVCDILLLICGLWCVCVYIYMYVYIYNLLFKWKSKKTKKTKKEASPSA
jgi:hypothetical protein